MLIKRAKRAVALRWRMPPAIRRMHSVIKGSRRSMAQIEMPVDSVAAASYVIPTDAPEADGTLAWRSTTLIVVTASAGGQRGIGWSYGSPASALLVNEMLAGVVTGRGALAAPAAAEELSRAVRNVGREGIASIAISAVDIALWDLKARLLGLPLAVALDVVHDEVEIYGSGGFTSYRDSKLADQLSGWVAEGIPRVKMKVGRDPDRDVYRVGIARKAVGDDVGLYVDANGAWTRAQALGWAERLAEWNVRWLEEPVSSDDLEGLAQVRDRAPGFMDVAAGEYGYDAPYFARMVPTVDCLQADVTRCGGFTGFRSVGPLCDAAGIDLSAHCAPQLSAYALATCWHARHVEWFHDHVRIERMLFDGVLEPQPGGLLRLPRDVDGHGLTLRREDAEHYRVR